MPGKPQAMVVEFLNHRNIDMLRIGILASVVVSRLLTGLLFDVAPYDPIILGVVALILGSVGLGASWVPALRASSVEPVEALRHD